MDMSGEFLNVTRVLYEDGRIRLAVVEKDGKVTKVTWLDAQQPAADLLECMVEELTKLPLSRAFDAKLVVESVREPKKPVTVLRSRKAYGNGLVSGGTSDNIETRLTRSSWDSDISKKELRFHQKSSTCWKDYRVQQCRKCCR